MIIHSMRSFASDHKGPSIRPIKALKAEEGDMVLDIPGCGYDRRLGEGVYLGSLGMYGMDGGRMHQTRCVQNGDPSCGFHITY